MSYIRFILYSVISEITIDKSIQIQDESVPIIGLPFEVLVFKLDKD